MNVTRDYSAVFESGHYDSDIVAYCFDGNDSTKWEGTADNSWVCVDFGSGFWAKVDTLKLKPRSSGGAQCKDFILYGSNNSTNGSDGDWTQIITGQHGNNENLEEFTIASPSAYRFLKVLVDTSWRGDFAGGSFYNVEMWASDYNTVSSLYCPEIMTSANTPSPYVASGSDNDSHQAPWMCFDSNIGNFYYCDSGQTTNYLKLDVGEPVTIEKYMYMPSTGGGNLAVQFTLSGSNDDSSWAEIDAQTGVGTTRGVWQEFILDSPATYRYYKWNNIRSQYEQATCLGSFRLIKSESTAPLVNVRRFAQII